VVENDDDGAPDWATEEAKDVILAFLEEQKDEVFYHRQLTVHFEDRFFHWVTGNALRALVEEGRIGLHVQSAETFPMEMKFFFAKRNRYFRRRATEIRKLVERFSAPAFAHAIGHQGETLVDAAMPIEGFVPVGRETQRNGDLVWTSTGHDLDRIFERDGVRYGTEIKNTLDYIDREQLIVKLAMCEHLHLRPLFVVRFAPKTYVERVRQAGGFTLVLKYQLYPFGQEAFAREVRERLGLPVDCPRALYAATVQRLLRWHLEHLGTEPPV
jgi:hypothetical protein